MRPILRWLIAALSVWIAVRVVPGIRIEEGFAPLLAVSLLLGAVNAIVRPLLRFLACGLIVVTLGLFLLVINAALLLLTARLSQFLTIDFQVEGFVSALLGSLIISLVTYVASLVLLPEPSRED
jgi:putative membrane protein